MRWVALEAGQGRSSTILPQGKLHHGQVQRQCTLNAPSLARLRDTIGCNHGSVRVSGHRRLDTAEFGNASGGATVQPAGGAGQRLDGFERALDGGWT